MGALPPVPPFWPTLSASAGPVTAISAVEASNMARSQPPTAPRAEVESTREDIIPPSSKAGAYVSAAH